MKILYNLIIKNIFAKVMVVESYCEESYVSLKKLQE